MEFARMVFYHTMKPIGYLVMKILYNFSFKNNPLTKEKTHT